MKDLTRPHEGAELTTNDEPLTRYYNGDKAKSEIDSNIGILKIRQRLSAYLGIWNCILNNCNV